MKEITKEMLLFKESVRHSWNTYFAEGASPASAAVQDAFAQVERSLFVALVLIPCNLQDRIDEYRKSPLSWLVVRPRPGLSEWPVQFGARDEGGNIKWRLRENLIVGEGSAAEFYDFFDWYPYGFLDLAYVRGRVMDTELAASKGSMLLIEQRHCQFLVET